MIASLNYGVEFEVKLSRSTAESIVSRLGLSWEVKMDLSVHQGCEIVSPVLSGQDGLDQIRKLLTAVRENGAFIDSECGFHVHVDAATLTRDDIKNAVKRYSQFESTIDSWHIRSRRASNNNFCKSMTAVAGRLDYWTDNNSLERAVLVNCDRFWKLNLAAYLRHGTLEFRQHAGTVDAEKAINWVIFCVNFVQASKVPAVAPTRVPVATPSNPYGLGNSQADRRLLTLVNMLAEGTTLAAMASATGLAETSIRVMLTTKIRKQLNLSVRLTRWNGIYKLRSTFGGYQAGIPAAPRQAPDDIFKNIPAGVVGYLKERSYELAA